MRKNKGVLLIIIVIVIMVSARLAWLNYFYDKEQLQIEAGQIDLSNMDLHSKTVYLNGEWGFYPFKFIADDKVDINNMEPATLVDVPGGWNEFLHDEGESSFGYGSYHLRIFVNPEEQNTYSIRIPSVRSASKLYVNGRYLAGYGKVAKTEHLYEAENIPYTASFTADENGVIDIVVQAANFKDVRSSGIIRSIMFGQEHILKKETEMSMMLQMMVGVFFLLHGFYALILFIMGNRNKVLLYYSILMTCMVFFNLYGSDDKIILSWLPISYDIGFKLVHIFWGIVSLILLYLIKDRVKDIQKKVVTILITLGYIQILLSIVLSTTQLMQINFIFIILVVIALLYALIYYPKKFFEEKVERYLVIISFIALMNQVFWLVYFHLIGIKIMYYPFDIIISLFCLASIWFRRSSRAHLQAEQFAKKLQKEDQLKDEFLANTSHELRNPLHGMLNMLSSVLEMNESPLDKRSKHSIELALQMGRHMSLTLDDLLDMTHLKEGTPRLNIEKISLVPIATGIIDMMRFLVEGKEIKLINNLQADLPKVYGDENRIIQVMFNIFHNAVKYTKKGEISINSHILDDHVHITITDTGIGVDEKSLEKVFEPYERLFNSGVEVESGVGIGLTISKQLIELQNGFMTVNSTFGKGSQFTFTLPIVCEDDIKVENKVFPVHMSSETELIKEHRPLSYEREETTYIDRPRVLIVDDEPVNIQVVKAVLAEENYDITAVTDAKDVLQLIHKKEWDLIISDVMMPDISGYELTRLVREQFTVTNLPILLLTARSQSTDIQTGFSVGANDYVTKPVEPVELKSRARLLIKVKQSIRQQLKMEAAWLQAQIQPHFLFNTLNSITALSEIDLERMRVLIDEFAHFLRSKFQFTMIDERHPIEDELNIVKSYLYIEQVRFTNRLNIVWEIEEDYTNLFIPLLTIQPLVENAIEHGLMSRHKGGTVTIRLMNYGTYTEISVIDDGIGMDEATIKQIMERSHSSDSGVGLINTHLRLKRYFGEGLTIESELGKGTTVSFKIKQLS